MGQKSVTNKTDMESFKKLVYGAGDTTIEW